MIIVFRDNSPKMRIYKIIMQEDSKRIKQVKVNFNNEEFNILDNLKKNLALIDLPYLEEVSLNGLI